MDYSDHLPVIGSNRCEIFAGLEKITAIFSQDGRLDDWFITFKILRRHVEIICRKKCTKDGKNGVLGTDICAGCLQCNNSVNYYSS